MTLHRTLLGSDPRTFTSLGPNTASLEVGMSGFTEMADATQIRTWYFTPAGQSIGFNDDRLLPSPLIEAVEGALVEVTLDSPLPHTIHFHGLDVDQANDGVATTSGYVADPGFVPTPGGFGRVDGSANLGTPFTYRFLAPHAGTYMYHCHVDTVIHLERGMIGLVIVRPPSGEQGLAWAGGPTFDREYVWQLDTFDSSWPQGGGATVSGTATRRYLPDYFMINGRDGANVLSDPTAAITAAAGEDVLVRIANFSYVPAVVDLGSLAFDVIASDGRPIAGSLDQSGWDGVLAAGERYDLLFTMPAAYSGSATVEYWDIRRRTLLGSATTSIDAV